MKKYVFHIYLWIIHRDLSCSKAYILRGIFYIYDRRFLDKHYNVVIMTAMVSQITSITIVYSTAYSRSISKKHQSSASLAFVLGIHQSPVNSPHKWPVTRKMFPFAEAQIKENIKAVRHWHFVRGIQRSPVDSPRKGPCSNVENVSIWWRHHAMKILLII